jgi:hypothetical protein
MDKTPDYAIEIHAKVLYTRFKKSAVEEAVNHAKKLKKSGDLDGYDVWMEVARQINKIMKKNQK